MDPKNPPVGFSVSIVQSSTGYTATVSPQLSDAKRGGGVLWFIDKPKDFPKSQIFVQFKDKAKKDVDGPLDGGKLTHGRHNSLGPVIVELVAPDGNSCDYSLYYQEAGKPRQLLCDPELVVDGNSFDPVLVKCMKDQRAQLKRLARAILSDRKSKAKKAKKR
jgi:hypothetical protein